jgi:hypothetical protein
VRLNEIYQTYKDKAAIYVVYIREAHPADGWQVQANLDEDIVHNEPVSMAERCELAGACHGYMNLEVPFLVDDMANQADEGFIAKPLRLFVLDEAGVVAYVGGMGPANYHLEDWAEAIKAQTNAAE